MLIDLHTHTNCSDGQHAPSHVVSLAKKQGVSLLAITDHDTTSGIPQALQAAAGLGVSFIPGIEISIQGQRELHILGYCIDPYFPALTSMCEEFARQRRLREERIYEYLEQRGVFLEREQVRQYTEGGLPGRSHFARAMREAGYVRSIQEAFDQHLGVADFDAIQRPKPSPAEGIGIIRAAGGVAVLAHPGLLQLDLQALETLLQNLIEVGLQGMECYYSMHTEQQTAEYLALANKYRLLVTGGSDYHGEQIKPSIQLGTGMNHNLCFVDYTIRDKLLAAAQGL